MIWRPPPYGWLKFNVCGTTNEDRARCVGVLRDKERVARALFSGPVVAKDSDLAEIKKNRNKMAYSLAIATFTDMERRAW